MPRTPRYPVYIPSKGRWTSNLTARALDKMGVPYRVVVEPTEVDQYAAALGRDRLLVLPFHDLGQGSIPARNWIWDDAVREGHERHWVLDDNLMKFYRLNRNKRVYARTGATFAAIEDFVDRYENVGLAGMQYINFAHDRVKMPPFKLNTRIYSCILVDNALPLRWRGRYNEDTDLSLRVLKSGLCTVLFNAFLCDKTGTGRMTGGNADELYAGDGRTKMAESLVEQHPDVAKIVRKWGRDQHHVDYRPFADNALRRRVDAVIPDGVDNYGMVLRTLDAPVWGDDRGRGRKA